MVYPPLESNEAYNIEFLGEGLYKFMYFMGGPGREWQPIFALTMALPVGSIGRINGNVEFMIPNPPISSDGAMKMARTFVVPEDLGTPAGAISLRGATNFQTPPGWDTVYTPIFNMVERPIAPMLVVRVETDWYPHETEFRYILQPGEAIPGSHTMPIGQVFFIPREEVTLRDCTDEEVAQINQVRDEFLREKKAQTLTTPYGLQYSPHYARQSKSSKT